MDKYKSKITPILEQLAHEHGCEFHTMHEDLDAGYIVDLAGTRHYFSYGTLDLNNNAATEIAGNKVFSSEIVSTMGIRVPKEKIINHSKNHKGDILTVLQSIGMPAVIKPVHGAQGKEVFRIDSAGDLNLIFNRNNFNEDDLIVQEYVDSPNEIRVVILDDEIVQAYKREYSHIIGDGIETIGRMVEKRNKYFRDRKRNTYIDLKDDQLIDILRRNKYDLNFVLSKNERLNISYGRNLSRGGEYEFISDRLSPTVREACKKIASISALRLIGIDLFILGNPESIQREDSIVFIEYNASPDMENNFYYDADYDQQLFDIYKKIFKKMCFL